jgi:hypothetical protein
MTEVQNWVENWLSLRRNESCLYRLRLSIVTLVAVWLGELVFVVAVVVRDLFIPRPFASIRSSAL